MDRTKSLVWKRWSIIYLLPIAFLIYSILCFSFSELLIETLQTLLRYSARISFLLFALAFSASSLHRLIHSDTTCWLLSHRRHLGISFALIHFSHLGLLLTKNMFFEPAFSQSSFNSLVGGIITYTFIGLMLITSFNTFSHKISKEYWIRLHKAGGYVILITFTTAYIRYTIDNLSFLPLLAVAVGVWAVRCNKKAVGSKRPSD